MPHWIRSSVFVFAAFGLAACASQQVAPLTASSTDQRGYATEYPARLAGLRGRFSQYELQVQQILGEFPTYPAQLDKPHWPDVERAVQLADQTGKSGAFAQAYAESHEVKDFFDAEGKAIKQKVGGAAQFAAKEKTCDVELYGPTAFALDKSVQKQLQDRDDSGSEAVQSIEDNADRIGEKNVPKLKLQVSKIAEVSYLTHVGMRQAARDMQALIGEASSVRSTLEDSVEAAKAVQADASRSKPDSTRAMERQKALESSLATLDAEVKQAEHVQIGIEERAKKLDTAYANALEALQDAIEAQAKAEAK